MDIIAQAIGIVAMIFNILSFQQKTDKGVIGLQLFGGLLFSINFFMLGAYGGGMLNVVCVIRAIVFLNKKKFNTSSPVWLAVFVAAYIASYIMSFTVFGTEPTVFHFILECLPVIGLTCTTIAFRHTDAGIIRRYGFVCSIMWLIYNIAVMSIGAIFCEAFSIVSIIIGMLRLDRKKTEIKD